MAEPKKYKPKELDTNNALEPIRPELKEAIEKFVNRIVHRIVRKKLASFLSREMGSVYYVASVSPGKPNLFRGGEKYPDTYRVVKISRLDAAILQDYDQRIQAAKDEGDNMGAKLLQESRNNFYDRIVDNNTETYTYTPNRDSQQPEVGKTFNPDPSRLVPVSPQYEDMMGKAVKEKLTGKQG